MRFYIIVWHKYHKNVHKNMVKINFLKKIDILSVKYLKILRNVNMFTLY